MKLSRRHLASKASLTEADLEEVARCRRTYNQLGFGYQVGFVRFLNRFPKQAPLELLDELVLFTGVQLGIDASLIGDYQRRRQTISEHQRRIVEYLGLRRFDADAKRELREFVFEAAMRLEQMPALRKRAREFLVEEKILCPADSTIARLVGEQRQRARDHIFERVADAIPSDVAERLEKLLVVSEGATFSPLQDVKANPGHPSIKSIGIAVRKLRLIGDTGVLRAHEPRMLHAARPRRGEVEAVAWQAG